MNYVERWNNNYDLYEKIKVHALGGYSSLKFVLDTFEDYSGEIAAIISIFSALEAKVRFSPFFPFNKDILIESTLDKIRKDFSNDDIVMALENIFSNEIEFSLKNPFIYLKNDFFVDLDSQLGEKTINGIKKIYKGFKQQSFCFTEENTDREALAKRVEGYNYSIVHNLETRHKDILDYIVKNISMSGKIDELYETYDIGSNEIGIRTVLKNVSHTTLQIPSTINGKTVVEIAPSAFSNDFNGNTMVTKVIIPNTVRKIGANAFENCSKLRIVEFGSNSSLYEIGDYAFYNCPLLNSINTPSNVILGECIFLNSNLILDEEYNSEIYSRVNNLGSINCMMEELKENYYLYKDFSIYFKFSVECEYEYDFNAIAAEGIKIWLYDSNLELLFEESTSINDGTNTAIIENLTPGDYYLRITAEDGNYSGEVEVIVDNDIAEREELAVDTETDVLEHLHNRHNEFFFMRNKTDFYEFWLIAEDSGEVIFPEGAITIFDSNGNIVEKFTIDNLDYSNSADSIYSATSITVFIEEYMNYYIDIDVDPNIEYSSLKIVSLSLGSRNLDSEDNLVETDNEIGDKIDIINVERTGHYDLNITYNGNQEEEILYVILKKDSNNNFTLIDKFLLNSENNAINENYIFNGGEVLYIGYFNYLGNGNIKLEINRIIKQKFDLMIDPNMNVVVGTEITVNGGLCGETTITQGYTRVCYLGMYAPNLDSRMLYEWSSSDETIAKVSAYGTITATATWTDNATCKKVKIKATYQSNITIVGEIEIEVYKDTRTDEKYLQYGMDVRETSPITGNEVTTGKGYPIPVSTSPTVVIHKSNTRLICLGNDSPSKIIQDFTWTSLDPSVAVVSQYGTITGYHSGETKILGVYKYNPRFKVEIILVVVTV